MLHVALAAIAEPSELALRYSGRAREAFRRRDLAPRKIIDITRDGDQLSFQLSGKRKIAIYPQSEQTFRVAQVDMTFAFEIDESGKAVAVVMSYNGNGQRLQRRGTPSQGSSSRLEPATQH